MANQSNEKTIKNFKRRVTSTRRQLHQFIKAMCVEDKAGEIEDILLGKGMAPCVACEWGNEQSRRDHLLRRNVDRKYRKETSAFGKRGQAYRRIIASMIQNGRRLEFHATKGLRSYMIVKAKDVTT